MMLPEGIKCTQIHEGHISEAQLPPLFLSPSVASPISVHPLWPSLRRLQGRWALFAAESEQESASRPSEGMSVQGPSETQLGSQDEPQRMWG